MDFLAVITQVINFILIILLVVIAIYVIRVLSVLCKKNSGAYHTKEDKEQQDNRKPSGKNE